MWVASPDTSDVPLVMVSGFPHASWAGDKFYDRIGQKDGIVRVRLACEIRTCQQFVAFLALVLYDCIHIRSLFGFSFAMANILIFIQ